MNARVNDVRVPLDAIAGWGTQGEAFWAYDFVMAAMPGGILMVPVHRVVGSLRNVCALCPVPYESALAVIDEDGRLQYEDLLAVELVPEAKWSLVDALAGPGTWFAAHLAEFRSRVLRHESGLRLAVAEEFVLRSSSRAIAHG